MKYIGSKISTSLTVALLAILVLVSPARSQAQATASLHGHILNAAGIALNHGETAAQLALKDCLHVDFSCAHRACVSCCYLLPKLISANSLRAARVGDRIGLGRLAKGTQSQHTTFAYSAGLLLSGIA